MFAMQRLAFAFFSLSLLLRISLQDTRIPVIHAPQSGQALQGVISIVATTAVDGFQNAELSFAYFNNPTNTWFSLAESETPVENEILAQWDTTTISDGDYTLRIVVRLEDGSELSTEVEGVRVRNYTAIETETPTPTVPTPTPAPSETVAPSRTPTITPSPSRTSVPVTRTPPPPNPAQLSNEVLLSSIGLGALAALGLLTLLGFYQGLRYLFRRK